MPQDQRWWEVKDADNLPKAVFAAVNEIKWNGGDNRRKNNLSYIALYENRELNDFPLDGISLPPSVDPGDLTLNVTSSCVDVLASKIAPNRPKPQYLTVDGDFSEQMKAKNRQRFVMGNFQGGQVYPKSVDVFLDAAICDIGAMKISGRDGKIQYERVFPNELLVDERGARGCEPLELFQQKWVATDVVANRWPKHKEAIEQSVSHTFGEISAETATGQIDDMVEVIEGWRLPSGPGAAGRHVIIVAQAVLLDEPWKDDSFPFALLRWTKLRQRFFGQGLVEQLHGLQEEITDLVRKIRDGHNLLGVPFVVKPRGSDVKNGSITNRLGEVTEYDGPIPPTVQVHPIMAPEVYQFLEYCFNKAFEVSGISQLSAIAKKPAGVESGVALRTLLDTETQRFALLVDAWQEFFLELARQTVKQARRMGGATATWRMREWSRKISWGDVAGEEDDDEKYVLQLWPVNLLPDTPTGKLAYVEQMITMGLLSPEQGQQLLDYPDVEAFQRTSAAGRDLVEMLVEVMLVEGRYIEPTKFMPIWNPDSSPGMAIHIVQGALLRGQINGWPEERLALLERWLDESVKFQPQPQPPPAPAMPPGMTPEAIPPELAPPGPPGAPPGLMPPEGELPPELAGMMPV